MRPTITLQKKISYPNPLQTTAVAELRVTSSFGIEEAIFVCRYIPVSATQEAHYEFYNVAYADQMHSVPTEPETLNRVCFVRRSSVEYYAENPLMAQKWCDEVYAEIQRLLQSYNVNYPMGSCDKVCLSEDEISVVPGVPGDDVEPGESASSGIFLAHEDEEGLLRIPDGHYPVGLEVNDIIYRIGDLQHDIENSVFIINTEEIRTTADVGEEIRDWKVWCFFGEDSEGGNAVTNSCECGGDSNVMGIVVNATENADGKIEIPDKHYPVGLEHNGSIYNINEVTHDDDRNVFIVRTEEVRVLTDFSGIKTYWRVWCVAKNQQESDSRNKDDSASGMIW